MDSKTLAALQSNTAVQMAAALTPVCMHLLFGAKKRKSYPLKSIVVISLKEIKSNQEGILTWCLNQKIKKKVHFITECLQVWAESVLLRYTTHCLQGPSDINDFVPVSV